jgi:hypothetical protein
MCRNFALAVIQICPVLIAIQLGLYSTNEDENGVRVGLP